MISANFRCFFVSFAPLCWAAWENQSITLKLQSIATRVAKSVGLHTVNHKSVGWIFSEKKYFTSPSETHWSNNKSRRSYTSRNRLRRIVKKAGGEDRERFIDHEIFVRLVYLKYLHLLWENPNEEAEPDINVCICNSRSKGNSRVSFIKLNRFAHAILCFVAEMPHQANNSQA